MKTKRIFYVLVISAAFAIQICAQTSKLVWENIRPTYEGFADIKPRLLNGNERSVYLIEPNLVTLEVFDEKSGKWDDSKYKAPVIDYFGLKFRNKKFKPKRTFDLTGELAWNYLLLGHCPPCYGVPSWGELPEYSEGRKYKLIIWYRETKNGAPIKSESPEFWVKPKAIK